jgi:hypothetical protein
MTTHLGYLVVFDGRTTTNGKRLLEGATGPHRIVEQLINVSPEMKRSAPKARQSRKKPGKPLRRRRSS